MRRTLRVIGVLLAAALLLGSTQAEPLATRNRMGEFLHPIQEPQQLRYPDCYLQNLCPCRKERVHIFGVNGLDPTCRANFNGLCRYFKSQGFENAHFGQLYTSHTFVQKIRQIRQDDPHARLVFLGFSLGCNNVRTLANQFEQEGIRIDLLIYLGGDFIHNSQRSYPDNVCRVLNITAHGSMYSGGDLFFKGADIDGARNYRLATRHYLIPSRKETVALIMEELLYLACLGDAPTPGRPTPAKWRP